MRLPSRDTVEKVIFVLSFGLLTFLYGFAAHSFGLFPSTFIEQAWRLTPEVTEDAPPFGGHDATYDRVGPRTVAPGDIQPGLTLISSYWEDFDWRPGLKLIDSEGRTMHQWQVNGSEIFSEDDWSRWGKWKATENLDYRAILGAYLFRNGDVLVNIEYVGTARLDACGQVLWSLPAGNHHSINRSEDGSFWIPGGKHNQSASTERYPDGLPGLKTPLHQDLLLHVSEDGTVLKQLNVLDILYENELVRLLFKGSHLPSPQESRGRDVTHLNDVEPLDASMADDYPMFEAGDLIVSLRNVDLVFVVDPDSEKVRWFETIPFIGQHDPDFMGDGWIGVFDNNRDGTDRGSVLEGSRIVTLQPHTDSVNVIFPTDESEPFYTEAVGQWQQLENGNLLLTESHAGRVVEVRRDGRTVWDWVQTPNQNSMVPAVFEAHRYSVSAEEVAEWPCSPDKASSEGRKATDEQ